MCVLLSRVCLQCWLDVCLSVCGLQVSEMAGWGVTNLVDPVIETHHNTLSVHVQAGDVIDNTDAVFWIAPQIYRGNKVKKLFFSLSLCLCVLPRTFCGINRYVQSGISACCTQLSLFVYKVLRCTDVRLLWLAVN